MSQCLLNVAEYYVTQMLQSDKRKGNLSYKKTFKIPLHALLVSPPKKKSELPKAWQIE